MSMNKHKIVHSVLSDRVLLARFGRDPHTALETRDVTSEFWQALTSFMFDGKMPGQGETSEVQYGGGDEQFVVTVRRV